MPSQLQASVAAARLGDRAAIAAAASQDRRAKTELLKQEIEQTDFSAEGLAAGWRLVKKFGGVAVGEPPPKCLLHQGKVLTEPRDKAELFAKHYCSHPLLPGREAILRQYREVRAAHVAGGRPESPGDTPRNPIAVIEITAGEVLYGCENARGVGPDGLHPTMLKHCGAAGRGQIRAVVNISLRHRLVPRAWRKARVAPCLKPGRNGHSPKDYRPLSLTSILSKIAERAVARVLAAALGPPPAEEIGFRAKRGCADAVTSLSTEIHEALADGGALLTVALDMSNAFDRVPPEVFLLEAGKLAARLPLEEREKAFAALDWCESFLSGRTLQVVVGDAVSETRAVEQGCPQGSVIGPLIWRLFFRSALQALEGCPHLVYADDILLHVRLPSGFGVADVEAARAKLQGALNRFGDWATGHNMAVSPDKSFVTLFSSAGAASPHRPVLKLGSQALPVVHTLRYLGVLFDSDGGFSSQFAKQLGEGWRRLSAIRVLAAASWRPPGKALRAFFSGFVLSLFTYVGGAWLPTLSDGQRRSLDALFYEAAKIVLGLPGSPSRAAALAEAQILPAAELASREATLLLVRAKRMPAGELLVRASHSTAPWVRCAEKVWVALGLERSPVLPEFVPLASAEVDLWHYIEAGSLQVEEEELLPADVANLIATAPAHERLFVFTDGSVSRSRGAYAWVAQTGGCRLEDADLGAGTVRTLCDPFLAEQYGIIGALRFALRSSAREVFVLTDSLGNILSIRNPVLRDAREAEICGLIVAILRSGKRVTLRFIRSHKGTPGNEAADTLARWLAQRELGRGEWQLGIPIPDYLAAAWARMFSLDRCRRALKLDKTAQAKRLHSISFGTRSPLLGPKAEAPSRTVESLFHKARIGAKSASGARYSLAAILWAAPSFSREAYVSAVWTEYRGRVADAARRRRPRPAWPAPSDEAMLHEYPQQVVDLIAATHRAAAELVHKPVPLTFLQRVAEEFPGAWHLPSARTLGNPRLPATRGRKSRGVLVPKNLRSSRCSAAVRGLLRSSPGARFSNPVSLGIFRRCRGGFPKQQLLRRTSAQPRPTLMRSTWRAFFLLLPPSPPPWERASGAATKRNREEYSESAPDGDPVRRGNSMRAGKLDGAAIPVQCRGV